MLTYSSYIILIQGDSVAVVANGTAQQTVIKEVKGHDWLRGILQNMLCHVFQRLLLEGDDQTRNLVHKVIFVSILNFAYSNLEFKACYM